MKKDFTNYKATYDETPYYHSYLIYPSTRKVLNLIKDQYGISISKAVNIAIYKYYQTLKEIHKSDT